MGRGLRRSGDRTNLLDRFVGANNTVGVKGCVPGNVNDGEEKGTDSITTKDPAYACLKGAVKAAAFAVDPS